MRKFILLTAFLGFYSLLNGQRLINFAASDGLIVSSDYYESAPTAPFLILLHQAQYSRGEYRETADRFVKLGYNCLAVDLRSGNEVNFITNNTARAAREKGLPVNYIDAKADIQAAIDYAFQQSKKEVVLLGSSYSASLSLIIATTDERVGAVVVFSPGEYFATENFVTAQIQKLKKPVFATSTPDEFPYVKTMLSHVSPAYLNLYKPSSAKGRHGSSVLWKDSQGSEECWLALMLFFNQIKE